MAGTGLSCTIPRNISAPLRYVDLSFNYILGSIPESIFQLPKLESLILSDNSELVGSLPTLGWNCNQTLQGLDLSGTNISGELPNSISNLRSLKHFMLADSSFSGFIPQSIGNLTHLKEMRFEMNKFSGSVPSTISSLNQLTLLDLSYNHFEGEIPDIFSNLQELTRLNFIENNFYGRFPSSIVNLTQLEFLGLRGSSQIGPLPSVATGLQKLQALYLSENKLNGTIPSWVFCSPSLLFLGLDRNQFTGSLPEISCKSSLQTVDLYDNQLDGLIPHSISNLVNARLLDLESNNFSGTIPPCIFSLPSLNYLILNRNRFTGNIPEISSNSSLEVVDLSNNQLDGLIPHSISKLLHARVLNFASNHFSGEVVHYKYGYSPGNAGASKIYSLGCGGVICLIEARRPFILNSLPKLVRLLSTSVEGLEHGTRIRVGGMAKGSGIIHPNMATMFGESYEVQRYGFAGELRRAMAVAKEASNYIFLPEGPWQKNAQLLSGDVLNVVLSRPLNCRPNYAAVAITTTDVVSKIRVLERGSRNTYKSYVGGMAIGKGFWLGSSILTCPQYLASIYGRDPNWGRIACATSYAGIPFNPNKLRIPLEDILIMDGGQPLPFDR
nr:receptor-like protein 12 [Ipomoea batatas]